MKKPLMTYVSAVAFAGQFVITHCPFVYAASVSRIERAILEEHFAKAEQSANEVVLSRGSTAEEKAQALYYRGIAQLNLGEYKVARSSFEKILKKYPKSRWAVKSHLGIIDSFYKEKKYMRALEEAQSCASSLSDPDAKGLLNLKMARIYFRLLKFGEAKKYLQETIHTCSNPLIVSKARQLLEEKRYFTVQVGAFWDRRRAERLMKELQSKGEYAYIVEAKDPHNKVFYRVRVGEFIELKDAKELKAKLANEGYPTHIYP